MKQAYSLPSIYHLFPQALPWASMPEALGFHQKSSIAFLPLPSTNPKSKILNPQSTPLLLSPVSCLPIDHPQSTTNHQPPKIPIKTPNPDQPIRNTLTHLALGAALGIALLAPASATPVTADLQLHLDASQLTGLSDGATMTTWTDVSGLGNDATASGTPIYKTGVPGVLNGQPVVRFNNSSSFTTADLSSLFQRNCGYIVAKASFAVRDFVRTSPS